MQSHFSLLALFGGSDIMILFVSLVLLAASIASWAIIIGKFRLWREYRRNTPEISSNDNPETVAERIVAPYDKNLYFLSMAGAVAPFIGLFGTVWGIIHSFAAIGATNSTSLGVIAPGLAMALGTTALGLIVAIPATIAYYYFSKKSDDLYEQIDALRKDLTKEGFFK
ncbi:MAG: MotA/TolQ/ExbB proton channel family protein [Rickettsiales bacterium]|jgi:biopolymer transport protein TolQ|nr:MotA/TolQ/ExbB proton channel family protein [Rickettsiales bacterium]